MDLPSSKGLAVPSESASVVASESIPVLYVTVTNSPGAIGVGVRACVTLMPAALVIWTLSGLIFSVMPWAVIVTVSILGGAVELCCHACFFVANKCFPGQRRPHQVGDRPRWRAAAKNNVHCAVQAVPLRRIYMRVRGAKGAPWRRSWPRWPLPP